MAEQSDMITSISFTTATVQITALFTNKLFNHSITTTNAYARMLEIGNAAPTYEDVIVNAPNS